MYYQHIIERQILYLVLEGISAKSHDSTIYTLQRRGERDLNPRVIADMGLAIPRPTKLGDPRTYCLELICK